VAADGQEEHMQKTVLPVLLSAALLAGCGTAAVPAAQSRAARAQTAPAPVVSRAVSTADTGAQQAVLAELAAIDPLLLSGDVFSKLRATCAGIAGGAEDLLTVTKIRFTGPDTDPVSDEQARRIIAAISDTGFCRSPAGR
jgi:hypothetical protein